MEQRFTVGDLVQTPLGKGIVREVRNNDDLLIEIKGRSLVFNASEVSAVNPRRRHVDAPRFSKVEHDDRSSVEVDLHGLTVEQAMDRVQDVLSQALLRDVAELRVIHGQTGGRIRAALHRRLKELPSVRGFRLDPGNKGVTIVSL
jgi:DNA mismatch repair protein MutS2